MSGETDFKSGYVALIGSPNVGKSTILNQFLKEKIAIVSAKPQTTRNKILGVLTAPQYQLIFMDTPGIHRPRNPLGEYMVKVAIDAFHEVDVILFVVDTSLNPAQAEISFIIGKLQNVDTPVILAINKIDLVAKQNLLPLMKSYQSSFSFKAIIPISAIKGEGLDDLLKSVLEYMPSGQPFYPPDFLTDQPERFIAGEIIREKIFQFTGQEIPYATAVLIDEFKENPAKEITSISATIYVEKDSQKGIIIGKGGALLKRIGETARREIEHLLGIRVFLRLWVKVRKDWTGNKEILKQLGY